MKMTSMIMSSPLYFDVAYAINPHMLDPSGNLNKIDKDLARSEWQALKDKFEFLGFPVRLLEGTPDLPDFVFCANTFFAWDDGKKKCAILSNMLSEKRRPEVLLAEEWLKQQGLEILIIPPQYNFEAMGDLIWNLESNSLYLGHGFRTDAATVSFLQKLLPYPITALELVDQHFYHLDTCFFTLNKECAAYVPDAFSLPSQQIIKDHFPVAIEISRHEALECFAGNAFCPDGKNVIMHPGAVELRTRLDSLGFQTHELDTSEFMKSGGSVFCLKNFIAENQAP